MNPHNKWFRKVLFIFLIIPSSVVRAEHIFTERYIASSVSFVEGSVNTALEIAKSIDDEDALWAVCSGTSRTISANKAFIVGFSRTYAKKEGKIAAYNKMLQDINYHLNAVQSLCPLDFFHGLADFEYVEPSNLN